MDLCSESSLSGKSSCVAKKNFNVGYCMQALQHVCFIPAMLIGSIGSFHFILFSVTLTWLRVTRSAQSKI